MIGTRLGNYEILDKLGEGGMGEVWRARDERLHRTVAIKILPPDVAGDPTRRARFEQEARALAALNHPNIVAVYDVGESAGVFYIVSELVEGESLRAVIERGPVSARKAIDIAVQMAEGMAAAHAIGIVHRDLKPENVMLTRGGLVKILDFGLAKQTHAPSQDKTATMALSQPGMVMGTAGYMSPEQVRAENVDARSDIFSFGAILYEMLTAKRAFHGATSVDTMAAVLNAEPPEFDTEPGKLPPALASIVRRCLEKRPEQRFQSAADLAFALRAITISGSAITGLQPALAAAPAQSKKRWLWPAVAVVAGAALVLAGFGARELTTHQANVTYQRITFRKGYIASARFISGGRNIVYGAAWDDGSSGIYLAIPGNPDSRDLGMPKGDDIVAVSSREELALLGNGTLAVTSVSGGNMRPLLNDVLAADFSNDGSSMAVLRYINGKVRLEYPIGTVLVPEVGWPMQMIRVSPDGNQVAYAGLAAGSAIQIFVADRTTGKYRSLGVVSGQATTEEANWLAWTPKGNEIWFHSFDTAEPGIVYAVDMKGHRRRVIDLPTRVKFYDISPDGQALLSTGTTQLGILGATPGATAERDLSCLDSGQVRGISEDGSVILANVVGESGGPKGSIYIRKTDGSPPVRVSDGHGFILSPDAKWVSGYIQDARGMKQFFVWPTGPGDSFEPHAPGLQITIVLGWLKGDQQYLVEGNLPKHRAQCFVWDAVRGTVRPLCPENPTEPAMWLSADRQKMLSQTAHNTGWSVYPVDGGPPREVPGLGREENPIGWDNDNRSVYVTSGRENQTSIAVSLVDTVTGQRKAWKTIHPAQPVLEIHDLRIAPNGGYAYTFVVGNLDLYIAKGLLH